MKNVEKPVTAISLSLKKNRVGLRRVSVFFFEKKCVSITRKVRAEPIAVARPAPYTPMSSVNTKK